MRVADLAVSAPSLRAAELLELASDMLACGALIGGVLIDAADRMGEGDGSLAWEAYNAAASEVLQAGTDADWQEFRWHGESALVHGSREANP